jgi:hypothetical protein
VLHDLGDLPGARLEYERAVGILRKVLGHEHPKSKRAQGNLEVLNKLIGAGDRKGTGG